MKVVIIGSGIAGIMAARTCHLAGIDFTLYEKSSRYGGHMLTDHKNVGGEDFPFDIGVSMVDPISVHPQAYALAKELGMTLIPLNLSETHEIPEKGIYWTSESSLPFILRPLPVLFSLLKRGNWRNNFKYIYNVFRFLKNTGKLSSQHPLRGKDLKALQASGEFGDDMFTHWLYPHILCWWGVPENKAPECSVDVIADSYYRVSRHPQYMFKEGWHTFAERIVAPFKESLKMGAQIDKVRRIPNGVEIEVDGRKEQYDHAIFATPPSEVIKMLDSPSPEESSLLSSFETVTTDIYFHTDASWMPKKLKWGLLNFTRDQRGNFVTFWHGKLQKDRLPYFVTWGDGLKELPDPKKTLRVTQMLRTLPTMKYRHNTCSFSEIQGKGNIWHCGAHVDSVVSENHMPVPSVWYENAFMSGVAAGNQIVNIKKRETSHVHSS